MKTSNSCWITSCCFFLYSVVWCVIQIRSLTSVDSFLTANNNITFKCEISSRQKIDKVILRVHLKTNCIISSILQTQREKKTLSHLKCQGESLCWTTFCFTTHYNTLYPAHRSSCPRKKIPIYSVFHAKNTLKKHSHMTTQKLFILKWQNEQIRDELVSQEIQLHLKNVVFTHSHQYCGKKTTEIFFYQTLLKYDEKNQKISWSMKSFPSCLVFKEHHFMREGGKQANQQPIQLCCFIWSWENLID